jgi:hypothetical protein
LDAGSWPSQRLERGRQQAVVRPGRELAMLCDEFDVSSSGNQEAHLSSKKYPCPVCGHVVFEEPPGSDDICLVCFWEDDASQLRWPELAGGANLVSLVEAQRNFARIGAIEERFVGDVRPPAPDEPLDPAWRPIEASDTFEEPDENAPWPTDTTSLYYFRRARAETRLS